MASTEVSVSYNDVAGCHLSSQKLYTLRLKTLLRLKANAEHVCVAIYYRDISCKIKSEHRAKLTDLITYKVKGKRNGT